MPVRALLRSSRGAGIVLLGGVVVSAMGGLLVVVLGDEREIDSLGEEEVVMVEVAFIALPCSVVETATRSAIPGEQPAAWTRIPAHGTLRTVPPIVVAVVDPPSPPPPLPSSPPSSFEQSLLPSSAPRPIGTSTSSTPAPSDTTLRPRPPRSEGVPPQTTCSPSRARSFTRATALVRARLPPAPPPAPPSPPSPLPPPTVLLTPDVPRVSTASGLLSPDFSSPPSGP